MAAHAPWQVAVLRFRRLAAELLTRVRLPLKFSSLPREGARPAAQIPISGWHRDYPILALRFASPPYSCDFPLAVERPMTFVSIHNK